MTISTALKTILIFTLSFLYLGTSHADILKELAYRHQVKQAYFGKKDRPHFKIDHCEVKEDFLRYDIPPFGADTSIEYKRLVFWIYQTSHIQKLQS